MLCPSPDWKQGCVTTEQRDPVPVMKRVQPHRTATLLTCLNYSHPGVYRWLAGRSHLEDYTGRELGGGGGATSGTGRAKWTVPAVGTRLNKKVLCNFIVDRIKKMQKRDTFFLGGYGICG